jgi:hypothetical protein
MTRQMLRDIAHARAGDKGDRSNISLFVYDRRHYEAVRAQVTAERLKQAYPKLFRGAVRRYELPQLHGLNFVLDRALEGGVNESLNLDSHGKSFSYLLLGLEVEVD